MSTNIINNSAFLRTSRNFPLEAQPLAVETNKSYVDIANAVNSRVIGLYPTNKSTVNGESWFLSGNTRQQAFRQVYTFTSTSSIAHGIKNFTQISPNSFGSFTDGTNWYGLLYASNVAIAGQISFYVTPTNIVFSSGAGVPTLTSGLIVLEWISQT